VDTLILIPFFNAKRKAQTEDESRDKQHMQRFSGKESTLVDCVMPRKESKYAAKPTCGC